MSGALLIYGANGYSGRRIARQALRRGLRPVLAGRNAAALTVLAAELELPYRVARVERAEELDAALRDVAVVVHAAGPFADTAGSMLQACLRAGAHYLDITGELPVIASLFECDGVARSRGIMAMPGVGFDVVPSDCLAAHVARRLPTADRLAIGIKGLAQATRGSAKTMAQYAGVAPTIRRDGILVPLRSEWRERVFDFGNGFERALCVVWGDVVTAFHTTGIPNIEVYFDAAPVRELLARGSHVFGAALQWPVWQTWLRTAAELWPEALPIATEQRTTLVIVAEAGDAAGRRAAARLHTPEAYETTAMTAALIAERALRGDVEVGVQTPARVYGPDLVLEVPGVRREDL